MIEKSSGYTSNGADFHATLEAAQGFALLENFNTLKTPNPYPTPADMAAHVMEHIEEFIAILTTKHRGRPRTKTAGKLKKAKFATAPLPLAEKEGA